jgi:hypothetical protein
VNGAGDTTGLFDAVTFAQQATPPASRALTFGPDSQTIAGLGPVKPSAFQLWLARAVPRLARPSSEEAVQVWTWPGGQPVAAFPGGPAFAYFAGGRRIAVAATDGTIEIWDIPPRRPWYIHYGLPVLFALLVLLGVRMVWRAVRRPVAKVTT